MGLAHASRSLEIQINCLASEELRVSQHSFHVPCPAYDHIEYRFRSLRNMFFSTSVHRDSSL